MKNIKVQFTDWRINAKALANPKSKALADAVNAKLTFHAYSDRMKAGVLEMIAEGAPITVSVTDETPETGEWME